MSLVEIFPNLDANTLVERFVPPPRFAGARFENYRPNEAHPSQQAVRESLQDFAQGIATKTTAKRWLPFRRGGPLRSAGPAGRYLDGGFGVGKTHLLASVWFAAAGKRGYMSFEELTAFIGFAGMPRAIETFRSHDLLCIDEFELDDVANTLMVVSFVRGLLKSEPRTWLCVTSNTIPESLGEQRFSASEFRREIVSIAEHFQELRIDGPDYRIDHSAPELRPDLEARAGMETNDTMDGLLAHLGKVHPVQYSALFDGVASVTLSDLHTIQAQDEALLFVQFIDKAYDARIPVRLLGCETHEVFAPRYRRGGYRKKYGRAESRINAMRAETT